MVGAALYFISRFTAKAISGLVLLRRYISVLIAFRYEYSKHNTSSPSWHDRNGSVSFSKALTTMGVLDGCDRTTLEMRGPSSRFQIR
jgi:hypothetical protein